MKKLFFVSVVFLLLNTMGTAHAEHHNAHLKKEVIPEGKGWYCFQVEDMSFGGHKMAIGDRIELRYEPVTVCTRTHESCWSSQMWHYKHYQFSETTECQKYDKAWVYTFGILDANHEIQDWQWRATTDKKACKKERLFYRDEVWRARRVSLCKHME